MQQESERYFFLAAEREQTSESLDWEAKASKEERNMVRSVNPQLLQYYYFVDIRDYAFRVAAPHRRRAETATTTTWCYRSISSSLLSCPTSSSTGRSCRRSTVGSSSTDRTAAFRTGQLQALLKSGKVELFNHTRIPYENKVTRDYFESRTRRLFPERPRLCHPP